ncbi:hypothetical protein HNP40_001279 [Mycobacteroides chelonae]|nr:hypothetical protein [Mycobacteroides chelonae]
MTTSEATGARPVGKEEVVEAVLNAAAQLFSEKGPAARPPMRLGTSPR